MDELIAKILSKGADISTRNAMKRILDLLRIEQNLIDQLYVGTVDTACRSAWEKTPAKNRAIFLPQCIRNSKSCQAELTEKGYICKRCNKCPVPEIIDYAKSLGYEHIYVVPGGSMIYKILKETKDIKSVLGVACLSEVCEGIERLYPLGFPIQAVQLLKAGCVDTIADVNKVKEKIKAGLQ
ncbi:MAG: DUF116 domain-containing protein [Archaeoglobaceae archaeon]|nr:DUF116 domain-containing protein [Archaeoglobaceae archaeon]MDW8117521.1 DUF116 domain-containing protein [Archaeoglobaceae archaeon]